MMKDVAIYSQKPIIKERVLRFCFITVCIIIVSVADAQPGAAKSKLAAFEWLSGKWQMKKTNGMLIESWMQHNDTCLEGHSYFINAAGDSSLLERIKLLYSNGLHYYIPSVTDQNKEKPVWFTITTITQNKFVAENAQHDFPRRITYALLTKDSIHAWIDDGKAIPEKRSDFYFSRQNE